MSALILGLALIAQAQAAPPAVVPAPPVAPAAADPVRLAAARRLLTATNIERMYDAMFTQLIPVMTVQVFSGLKDNVQVPAAIRTELAKPDREAAAERMFAAEVQKGFKAEYPDLKDATAREYAAVFTADEMDRLTAFYQSPLGQKTLAVMPQLQARIMPIGMRAGQKVGAAAIRNTIERLQLDHGKPAA